MPVDHLAAPVRRRPSQARGRARRDRILDAAAEQLGEVGAEALTTNAIARIAETSVGSIYDYFADREAIAVALATRFIERYDASPVHASTPAALADVLVDRVVSWWDQNQAIAALWWLAPSSRLGHAGAVLREGVLAATAEVIAECVGLANPDRTRRSADMVFALTTGVLHARLSPIRERGDTRRDASLALGAVLATELTSVLPSRRGERQEDGDVSPSVARSGRALDGRQRMLDAAVDRLVADGYGGATTLAIQAAAGVSRGRLLHQFPSRGLLLVAAVEHLANQRVGATQRRVVQIVQADRDGPSRIDHVIDEMWASYQEPHYWAASELWMAARTNPEIAASLRPHEHRLGATIRTAVGAMFGEPYAADDRFPMLRDVLLTSMRGAAAAYAFERRDPAGDPHIVMWKELARLVLMPTA